GIYSGGEDNRFFRRDGQGVEISGERSLRPRDVCLLGDDVIHQVYNPTAECAGAIHVYGGDFFATPRSEWVGEPLREGPFDVDRASTITRAMRSGSSFGRRKLLPAMVWTSTFGHAASVRRSSSVSPPSPFSACTIHVGTFASQSRVAGDSRRRRYCR